jgi:hypothetical protein
LLSAKVPDRDKIGPLVRFNFDDVAAIKKSGKKKEMKIQERQNEGRKKSKGATGIQKVRSSMKHMVL